SKFLRRSGKGPAFVYREPVVGCWSLVVGDRSRAEFCQRPTTNDQRPGPNMKSTQHHPLEKILEHRIVIIDGAMGTTIRTYGMKEVDIRGERFKDAKKS